MKRIVLAAAVAAAAAIGSFAAGGAAQAQGVVVGAGPGGVYVGARDGYYHRHHWRRTLKFATRKAGPRGLPFLFCKPRRTELRAGERAFDHRVSRLSDVNDR